MTTVTTRPGVQSDKVTGRRRGATASAAGGRGCVRKGNDGEDVRNESHPPQHLTSLTKVSEGNRKSVLGSGDGAVDRSSECSHSD